MHTHAYLSITPVLSPLLPAPEVLQRVVLALVTPHEPGLRRHNLALQLLASVRRGLLHHLRHQITARHDSVVSTTRHHIVASTTLAKPPSPSPHASTTMRAHTQQGEGGEGAGVRRGARGQVLQLLVHLLLLQRRMVRAATVRRQRLKVVRPVLEMRLELLRVGDLLAQALQPRLAHRRTCHRAQYVLYAVPAKAAGKTLNQAGVRVVERMSRQGRNR